MWRTHNILLEMTACITRLFYYLKKRVLCCTSGNYCGYYKIAIVVQVQFQIHIFTLIQLQCNNNEKKKK